MKWLHQTVAIVLLVLWVPITAHCTLESIPGLAFLKCNVEVAASDADPCDDDACAQLESATYRPSDTHTDFQPPSFTILFVPALVQLCATEHSTVAVIETLPELPLGWQFIQRTALPPRAPTSLS